MFKYLLIFSLVLKISIDISLASTTIPLVEYPPYIHKESNGKISGVFYEIIKRSFELAKVDVNYRFYPLERLRREFMAGSLPIWLGYKSTFSGKKIYNELNQISFIKIQMILIKNSKSNISIDINKPGCLKGKTIGILRGFDEEMEYYKKLGADIQEFTNHYQMLKMVEASRIDFSSLAEHSFWNYQSESKNNKNNLVLVDTGWFTDVGIIFASHSKELSKSIL